MFDIIKIDKINGITKSLSLKEFVFPGGEVSVKLNAKDYAYTSLDLPNTIVARLQTSDDILKLALVKDALGEIYENPINLILPYVPFARQDRICDDGEAFSIVEFARFIADLGFGRVTMVDPHSNVTPAVFKALRVKTKVISQLDVLNKYTAFIPTLMRSILVSPDAGSNKKVSDAAAWLSKESFARADKLRDLTNGKIKEIVVYRDDFLGQDVVIPDDLCEFGGTFIGLAKELRKRNCGKVILFVTHGVFGNTKRNETLDNLFKNGIDEVWTTDSYSKDLAPLTAFYKGFNVLNLTDKFFDKI